MKKHLITLGLCVALTGCATQGFNLGNEYRGVSASGQIEFNQHFFIKGLGQVQDVNLQSYCGGLKNVVRVEAKQTILNWLLGFLTWGIYTPRQAVIYCKK